MRILVTGSKGQLGTELLRVLEPTSHEVLGIDIDTCDISDRDQCLGAITGWSPEVILHGAAFTAVDVCEVQPELAYRVNSLATRFIADGARRVGAHVVYDNPQQANQGHAPVVFAPVYPTPAVVAPYCHKPVVYVPARPVVYAPPAFTYVYEQQWVPPVFQTQIIGYDHCGRAITQQVCVAQGYYRTMRYRLYGNGAKVFDGYV